MGKALMVGGAFAAGISHGSGDETNFIGSANDSATELNSQVSCTEDAAFTGLRGRILSGGSGTNTFQFRDNTANGQNVAARAGAGVFEDTTHTDSLQAADVFDVAYTDTGTNSVCSALAINVEFASGHGNFHGAANFTGAVIFDLASTTTFIGIGGDLVADGSATEAPVQWKTRAYTSWEALQVRAITNGRANNSDFVNRTNGATGAALCRFAAATTGLVVDTAVGDAIADGDLVNVALTLGAGVEDLTISFIVATLKSTSSKSDTFTLNQAGLARAASTTASYVQIGGHFESFGTDANARIKPGFAGVASNLRCYLSVNTYTGAATLKLMQNGSAVLTTSIGAAGGAAWYENTADSISFVATDEFSFEIDEGTGSTATIRSIGLTFAPAAAAAEKTPYVPTPQLGPVLAQ